jgi:hypothetical protein
MKPTTLLFLGFLFIVIACKNPNADTSGTTETADTTKTEADAGTVAAPDSAAMMKAWMDFATPGPMHAWMAKSDGTWTGDVTAWMDPDAPPTKSTSTMTQKMALNGLYQMGDYSGTMMGMPFMGHSILAYDNAKKEFVNTWIDNMGSGIMLMKGNWDEGSKTLSLKGAQTDPFTGKDTEIRQEIKFADDNTQMMTMWGQGMDGKEMKFMEVSLKRKV